MSVIAERVEEEIVVPCYRDLVLVLPRRELNLCFPDASQLIWRCSSGHVPLLLRSPAWIRMPPEGRSDVAAWVSDRDTILRGFLDSAGIAMGHWCVYD